MVLTLDGGRADDEGLLEGFGLATELGGSALRGQAGDVDGGLLVESRRVVEQRHGAAQGQRRAARGGHLEGTGAPTRGRLLMGALGVPFVYKVLYVRFRS